MSLQLQLCMNALCRSALQGAVADAVCDIPVVISTLVGFLSPGHPLIQDPHNTFMHLTHKVLGVKDGVERLCFDQVPIVDFLQFQQRSQR